MSDYSYGFDDFEKMIDEVMEIMPKAADSIVKEIGLEVLEGAVNNVNGPKNQNIHVKRGYSQPYPVSVNTGQLKRSLKIKKISNGKYKVFADIEIANYADWVHNGTSRMRPRPFLDDAVKSVINSGRYVEIANGVLEEFLGGL